jgi:small-conductance mechanosensitive channel
MAAAAVELAESYQRQRHTSLLRWLIPAVIVVCTVVAILGALGGEILVAVVFGLSAVVNVAHLALNPAMRPKSVARSLDASRQRPGG